MHVTVFPVAEFLSVNIYTVKLTQPVFGIHIHIQVLVLLFMVVQRDYFLDLKLRRGLNRLGRYNDISQSF